MLAELRTAKEIAIDLEHHDARSYIGLVSLMQISTREKDWIVDTLKPWRQDLQVLNEVFTDPKILKVLHGAFMDILWLQRDLGLYIVGLFDTNHACKALGYAGGSLAFLLKKFIDFDADKKYQMADWRIRPLPEGMFFYARADTHFLLYIYDNMRNELVERSKPHPAEENKLEIVLRKSKETSLFRYESPRYNAVTGKGPGGWFQALVKVPTLLNNEQFAVFRAVHAWRDKIARQDDDSTNFVMPNHTLLSVAKVMPTDMASLLGTVHPISYNVKARTGELLELIKAAKTNAKDGPSMMEVLKPDSLGAVAAAHARASKASEGGKQSVLAILSGEAGTDMRSPQSAFWGRAFGSSTWEEPSTLTKAGEDIRLAIPLPPLAEDAFSEGMREYSILAQPVPEPEAEEEPVVVEEPAFTIKGGRKRKSDDMEEEVEEPIEEAGEYDISLHEPLEGAAKEKAAKKAERKAAKKAAKAAKRGDGESPRAAKEEDDEEPFDYSKAESVMNKKRTNDYAGGKKGGKKPFDPYQKSADASTGMRRLQTERPGKSFTFKG
jgi:exosome complex exonuclease RRP6